MTGFRSTVGFALVLALAVSLPVRGDEGAVEQQLQDAGAAVEPEVFANPLGLSPIRDDGLASERGGAQTANDMELSGVVGNNHASDLVTGHNVVSEGSLTGNAGFATVVQNSGNNVLIQNATIINLQVQ